MDEVQFDDLRCVAFLKMAQDRVPNHVLQLIPVVSMSEDAVTKCP